MFKFLWLMLPNCFYNCFIEIRIQEFHPHAFDWHISSLTIKDPSLLSFVFAITLLKTPGYFSWGDSHCLDFAKFISLFLYKKFLSLLVSCKLKVGSRGIIWLRFCFLIVNHLQMVSCTVFRRNIIILFCDVSSHYIFL